MRRALLCLGLITALLSGCASPPPRAASETRQDVWSGRLALQVEEAQSQSFSAGFELQGSAQMGELRLFSPLGGTVGVLTWKPGAATLQSGDQVRQFDSLEALAQQATGTALPIGALFDWLRGIETRVPGWEVDLSQVSQGRLRARRVDPAPVADLRVAFER